MCACGSLSLSAYLSVCPSVCVCVCVLLLSFFSSIFIFRHTRACQREDGTWGGTEAHTRRWDLRRDLSFGA